MTSPGALVLLTGATGFVGHLTLLKLLESGYRVRVAVRSQAGIDKIVNSVCIKAVSPAPNALFFIIVPDMAKEGAFDEAVKQVTYIVHIASPVPSFGAPTDVNPEQYETYFVKDAVASHINMLKSAMSAGGSCIKRVVLTSSCMGIMSFDYYTGSPKVDYSVNFGNNSRAPDPKGPYGNEVQAYAGGKVTALNATERWMAENRGDVGFDLINIVPGFIFGHDYLTQSAQDMRAGSTNSILLNLLLGSKGEWPFNGNAVLGEDVAKVHVLALEPSVKGNRSFLASKPIVWEHAIDVLRSKYLQSVEAGHFSIEGKQPTLAIKMDASETEQSLGIKFATYEEQVRQVADQYLELLAESSATA